MVLAIHSLLTSFQAMSYRKLKADKIFDGYRFIENSVLIVSKDGIIEILLLRKMQVMNIEIFTGIHFPWIY